MGTLKEGWQLHYVKDRVDDEYPWKTSLWNGENWVRHSEDRTETSALRYIAEHLTRVVAERKGMAEYAER